MIKKDSASVLRGSACLEKACVWLLVLQPIAADLVLMICLEVLLWTA